MTPNLEPFFAGTYFPRARFQSVLMKIADLWEDDRTKCEEMGKNVIEQLKDMGGTSVSPGSGLVRSGSALKKASSPAYLALWHKCCQRILVRKSSTTFAKRMIPDTGASHLVDPARQVPSFQVAR